MTNWRRTFKFKDLLNPPDYDPDKELRQVPKLGRKAAKRIEDSYLFTGTNLAARFKKAKTQTQFNKVMDDLYEYADRNLIWLE